jgi:Ser/Thr protein kinase RdoA (MazF antagonist)
VTAAVWAKRYPSIAAARRAVANHRWLERSGLPVPALDGARGHEVAWRHVAGRHVETEDDLVRVAVALGRWHRHLAESGLPADRALPGFLVTRTAMLVRLHPPGAAISAADAACLRATVAGCPPSVYKDVNVRNILLDGDRVVHVDFDDLTLAPAGYDLAKLVISYAMTRGARGPVEEALRAYNDGAVVELCTASAFMAWIELHHVLTHRYIADGPYTYSWAALRAQSDAPLLQRWREDGP